jgi:hypothetical protein
MEIILLAEGWYQELVIVPNPANDSTILFFSIGVTTWLMACITV